MSFRYSTSGPSKKPSLDVGSEGPSGPHLSALSCHGAQEVFGEVGSIGSLEKLAGSF